MVATLQSIERRAAFSQHLNRECQLEGWANCGNLETSPQKPLAQPRIDQRRLPAGVGADEQAHVCLFDAGDRRIKQIPRTAAGVELGSVLTTIHVRSAKSCQKLLEGEHRFGVAEVTSD